MIVGILGAILFLALFDWGIDLLFLLGRGPSHYERDRASADWPRDCVYRSGGDRYVRAVLDAIAGPTIRPLTAMAA